MKARGIRNLIATTQILVLLIGFWLQRSTKPSFWWLLPPVLYLLLWIASSAFAKKIAPPSDRQMVWVFAAIALVSGLFAWTERTAGPAFWTLCSVWFALLFLCSLPSRAWTLLKKPTSTLQ
jgi:hypothetical protein